MNAAAIEPVAGEPAASERASRPRLSRGRVLVLAGIGALLLALMAWRARREPEPSAEPARERPSTHVAMPAAEPAPAPAAPIERPAPSTLPEVAEPAREPKPIKRAVTKANKPAADRAGQSSTVRATPPAASCAQPYTIDAQGIRHPKPECL